MNKVEKKYNIRVMITMSIYCLLVFASIYTLKGIASDWPVWIRALMALTPVIPVAFFCKAYVTYLNECDEMLRRIELEAIGLSTVVVGLLYLSLGFLGRSNVTWMASQSPFGFSHCFAFSMALADSLPHVAIVKELTCAHP